VVQRLQSLGLVAGMNKFRSVLAALVIGVVPGSALLGACSAAGEGDGDPQGDPTGGQGATDPGDGDGICLMNNCSSDEQCAGCSDGRVTCLEEESRCVACDPTSGAGCADGEYCTSYGLCAPNGVTCPTDDHGTPTITCAENADCIACSPMNQVCDTATGRCQACTDTNTQHCLQSDLCIDGACSPKCPSSCTTDNDCGECGGAENPAHACNAHQCAECSDTYPCAAGLACVAGTCTPQCGIPGPVAGDCVNDSDCTACGDASMSGGYLCKKPINQQGPGDHGTCTPQAAGCSDLGHSVAVLPAPWGDVTQLCSGDGDCAGAGITFNVGDALRDLVGDDAIDLGFTEIEIHDANVQYAMPVCADIELTGDISCGVCAPCQNDDDCAPIAIDPLVGQLFQSDPLAQIAAAMMFDLLWGDDADHNLNFFCQPVAAGYGVCAPCANPLQACGSNQEEEPGTPGGSSCDHDACSEGGALDPTCDSCADQVCDVDPYCCGTAWDSTCVGEATSMCGTCAAGGGTSSCAHSECTAGDGLDPSCSSCADAVCAADPYCCNTEWDSVCVNAVPTHCGADACSGGGGSPSPSCEHYECTPGDALDAGCSDCAAAVCAEDDYCCTNEWDSICVDIAEAQLDCSC
jgi:hypothetical protein